MSILFRSKHACYFVYYLEKDILNFPVDRKYKLLYCKDMGTKIDMHRIIRWIEPEDVFHVIKLYIFLKF